MVDSLIIIRIVIIIVMIMIMMMMMMMIITIIITMIIIIIVIMIITIIVILIIIIITGFIVPNDQRLEPLSLKAKRPLGRYTKDEINVPIALGAFRDGDQGPSKVTKTVSGLKLQRMRLTSQ